MSDRVSDRVTDPRVTLLAYTALTDDAFEVLDENYPDPDTLEADHLAEIAGRQCYESWSRPNPATASNYSYLANVISQGHTSVLAHASFTFRLTGVSRSLTHELIRHRFLAVSEVSQRYVDMESSYLVQPPAITESRDFPIHGEDVHEYGWSVGDEFDEMWKSAIDSYKWISSALLKKGYTRKQAREAARCVLPGGTETKMIVSGNVRAWRDFIAQRNTSHADAEIREVAGEILAVLREYAPNSVSDLVSDDVPE